MCTHKYEVNRLMMVSQHDDRGQTLNAKQNKQLSTQHCAAFFSTQHCAALFSTQRCAALFSVTKSDEHLVKLLNIIS